ncbi:MAG TPA: lasso RiPP family leader peptide-containing protein [Solirubrobacteraceae bacterium]|jgi:hypothetical protein
MDDQMTFQAYEAPRVVDYGDLQELTASCLGGHGGDALEPSGHAGAFTVGASNPAVGVECSSKP